MKIEYLGFLPAIIVFIFLNYSFYLSIKNKWEGGVEEIVIVSWLLSWVIITVTGFFWGLSSL